MLLPKVSLRLQPIVLVPSVHTTAFKVYFVRSLPNLPDTRGDRELRLFLFRFNRLVLLVFCTCAHSSRPHLVRISFRIRHEKASCSSDLARSLVDKTLRHSAPRLPKKF